MSAHFSLGESTPLANQVAGHPGVMSDASGSLVIKPALPREIAFYSMITAADPSDPIYALKPFVPRNYGTLRLEGQLQPSGGVDTAVKDSVPESVVLENLSYAYTHPNIMDAKLGTVLHDPDASDEKKQKMEKQARTTTSSETGLRLTGCQTWHVPTQSYISTPKSFGRNVSVPKLPLGMVRFFPLPSDVIASLVTPPSPPPAATPLPLSSAASAPPTSSSTAQPSGLGLLPTSVVNTIPSEYTNHAIPPALLFRLLTLLLSELDRLHDVMAHLEIRLIGASLLIVYEADPARLESALDRLAIKHAKAAERNGDSAPRARRSAFSDDGSSASLSDSDSDLDTDDDGEDSDLDLDGTKDDARQAMRCPPLTVKLIDFAHAWLVEGEGPDEGLLKGMKTLRGLVEGRLKEVEEALC